MVAAAHGAELVAGKLLQCRHSRMDVPIGAVEQGVVNGRRILLPRCRS